MAEPKTTPTTMAPADFLAALPDAQRRADATALVQLLGEVSGEPAVMWGPSIVGFGSYHYRYASGRPVDWFILGFSPRKLNLTLYLPGYLEQYGDLLAALGKHSSGKGCLYIKKLSDIDQAALRRLLEAGVRWHRTAGQTTER